MGRVDELDLELVDACILRCQRGTLSVAMGVLSAIASTSARSVKFIGLVSRVVRRLLVSDNRAE